YALRDSEFRSRKMPQPKSANDCVKRMIRKGEMFYVSLTIFDRGVQSLRQFYHPRRQINTDRTCAAICGLRCKSARTARDIQQTYAGVQMHTLEKSIGSQSRHRCKKCVIAPCQSIMTLAFEGPQSFRIAVQQFCWRHNRHRLSCFPGTAGARQHDREFRALPGFGYDLDASAVLLDDDVVCHRQAEPRPLAGRLRRKERVEHLILHLGRDASAVVADADLHGTTEVFGRRQQRWLK